MPNAAVCAGVWRSYDMLSKMAPGWAGKILCPQVQRVGNCLPAGCVVCGQVMVRFCERRKMLFLQVFWGHCLVFLCIFNTGILINKTHLSFWHAFYSNHFEYSNEWYSNLWIWLMSFCWIVQWESPVFRSSSSQNREACASGTNARVVQRAAYLEKEAQTITEPTQAFRYLKKEFTVWFNFKENVITKWFYKQHLSLYLSLLDSKYYHERKSTCYSGD